METEFVGRDIDGAKTAYAWCVNDMSAGLKSIHACEGGGVSAGVQGRGDFFSLDAQTIFDVIQKRGFPNAG